MWANSYLLVAQNYSYRQYTTDDGLPTNYVYGAIEDEDGYMWVFTENGISKFDGYTFQNFTTEDGLPHNDVPRMMKDTFGTIWIVSMGKTAAYLENDSIIKVDYKKGLILDTWLVDGKSLYYSKGSRFSLNKKEVTGSGNFLFDYKKFDKNKNLQTPAFAVNFFSDKIQKQFRYTPLDYKYFEVDIEHKKIEHYQLEKNTLFNNIDPDKYKIREGYYKLPLKGNIYTSNKKNIVLSSKNGVLFIKEKATLHKYYSWKELINEVPKHSTFYKANEESFFIETNNYYIEFDESFQVKNILDFEDINSQYTLLRLFIDSKGNHWIGTREGGLFFISHKELNTTLLNPSIKNDQVIEHIISKDDKLLAFSDNINIYEIQENNLELIKKLGKPTMLHSITQSANNDIVIANKSNTLIYNDDINIYPTLFSEVNLNDGSMINSHNLKYVYEDIVNNGIYHSSSESTYYYNHDSGEKKLIKNEQANYIHYDTLNQETYFAFGSAIYSLEKDENKLSLRIDSLNSISCLYPKDKEHLWIGTHNKGLIKWNKSDNSKKQINSKNYIRTIIKHNTQYFLASNEGILVLDEHANELYCYDKKDGLPSTEILDLHIDDTHIYAATFKGIAKIRLEEIQQNKIDSNNLSVTAFKIGEIDTTNYQSINLKNNQNDILIQYNLIDYASKGNVNYKYKLEPIQKEWIQTKERSVIFQT